MLTRRPYIFCFQAIDKEKRISFQGRLLHSKAHKWFQKAAAAGDTDAMIHLGCLYQQGLSVAQDYGKALEWFQKAADAGNTDAMIYLGRLYDLTSNVRLLDAPAVSRLVPATKPEIRT